MNKPQWVFVAGTYRSGSTTQYRIASAVVEAAGAGVGIGYHTEDKLKGWDASDRTMIVCKVFEPLWLGFQGDPSYGGQIFKEGRAKAIVTVRNPLDVMASMNHRKEGRDAWGNHIKAWDFEQTAKEFIPLWLRNLDTWIALGPQTCLVSRFETLIQDVMGECRRIAQFLDLDIPADKLLEIAQQNTRDGIIAYKAQCKAQGTKEDAHLPAIPQIVFGTSGHYAQELTQGQINMVQRYNQEFMKKYGYLPPEVEK